MSVSDEEPYSTIFASLKHPIRRRILRMLSEKPMSFSEMLEALGVSNSFLTYHLENLGELVGKMDDGRYKLSSFGQAAMSTMTKVEDIPTTAPQRSPQTKPKRVVRRNVAMALGIMCIVLVAGIGGAIIHYSLVVSDKDKTISSQNSQVSILRNQNIQLQTWLDGNETLLNQTQANNTNLQNLIDSLNSNVTKFQNEINNLHIMYTEKSTVWVNNENVGINRSNTLVGWLEYVPSAGYVSIRVSSNDNSTNVAFENYNTTNVTSLTNFSMGEINVGFGGTVVIPILPNWVEILVGSVSGAKLVVTITYYY